MRSTERTIICDRCGNTKPVKDWNSRELKVLAERGWSSYLPSWLGGKCIKPTQDLCPPCTTEMKNFMENSSGVYLRVRGKNGAGHGKLFPTTFDDFGVRVADISEADERMLTDLRANINSELRRRRNA